MKWRWPSVTWSNLLYCLQLNIKKSKPKSICISYTLKRLLNKYYPGLNRAMVSTDRSLECCLHIKPNKFSSLYNWVTLSNSISMPAILRLVSILLVSVVGVYFTLTSVSLYLSGYNWYILAIWFAVKR